MTQYDNSPLYYKATLEEETIIVPANTTYEVGAVLGEVSASGKLTQFKKGNSDGSEVPVAVLNKQLVNDTASAVEYTRVSVIIAGIVDVSKLIFDGTDTIDSIITYNDGTNDIYKGKTKTLLKNNGIFAVLPQNLTTL